MRNKIFKKVFLVVLFCPLVSLFAQDVTVKEFVVIDTKDLLITEMPDISSKMVPYRKEYIQPLDTLGVIDKNDEFYKLEFFSNSNGINSGWVSRKNVKKTFSLKQIFRIESLGNKIAMNREIKQTKSHPEWNAVIKNVISNGG